MRICAKPGGQWAVFRHQVARRALRSLPVALWVLTSMIASPVSAQDKQDDSIVVVGRKLPPDKQVRRFVRQVASTIDGQLSRFDDPICPLVIGLSAESNRLVEERIRRIAADANIRRGKGKCPPNLILLIAHDADTFVDAMRKRFPAMFAALSSYELKRALEDGPVHVWNTVEVRNEDGQRISGVTDEGVKVLEVRSASRITLPTQQVVVRSVLVIDSNATVGKTLTQVSDYVAMRAMAGARPPREAGAADTILRLFDKDGPPPDMLTTLDKGFLRGLYRTKLNGRATSEMSLISRTIVKGAKVPD